MFECKSSKETNKWISVNPDLEKDYELFKEMR